MNINKEFEQLLNEGVHDKGIFKAVFLAGGPGSGKDYVLKHTLDGHGLIEVNADKLHDHLESKFKLPADDKEAKEHLSKKVKNINDLRQVLAVHGRNGLIVNGTHDDHHKVKNIKKGLENLGYETSMVMVHTHDEASRKRNVERSQKGGRAIPESARRQKWEALQASRQHHAKMFGGNYHEFDNSEDLRNSPPETIKQKKDELAELHDKIHEFVNTPSSTEKSQKWIEKQVKTDSTPIPRKGTSKLPHFNSQASQQASELGLSYFGSGRYGKNGQVTHHAISDNLEEINKDKPKAKPKKSKLHENLDESFNIMCNNIYNFQDIVKESIDCNIEPGLSMATSGENLNRDATGKEKEDIKKGISLSKFRSKKVIQ